MSGRQDLVLIPGLYADAGLWEAQSAGLADIAQIHVADVTRDASIAAMAARILAAASERFAVAGLSMGGYVALELWRQAPGRVARILRDRPYWNGYHLELRSLLSKFINFRPIREALRT